MLQFYLHTIQLCPICARKIIQVIIWCFRRSSANRAANNWISAFPLCLQRHGIILPHELTNLLSIIIKCTTNLLAGQNTSCQNLIQSLRFLQTWSTSYVCSDHRNKKIKKKFPWCGAITCVRLNTIDVSSTKIRCAVSYTLIQIIISSI